MQNFIERDQRERGSIHKHKHKQGVFCFGMHVDSSFAVQVSITGPTSSAAMTMQSTAVCMISLMAPPAKKSTNCCLCKRHGALTQLHKPRSEVGYLRYGVQTICGQIFRDDC
jgi:hypothetical protein